MEETVINIFQTLGLPIALIVYYLFVERPRQEKRKVADDMRHDNLVDKIILAQTDCANKMNSALMDHTTVIKDLTDMIHKLEERLTTK